MNLTVDWVEALAGPRVFARGIDYAERGHVTKLERTSATVRGEVAGTFIYTVEVRTDGSRWACDCPAADDGSFCKHCVAVFLAATTDDTTPEDAAAPTDGAAEAAGEVDVEAYLRACDNEQLIGLLMEAADRDAGLWRRLEAAARTELGAAIDIGEYRALLDSAVRFRSRRFVDYREAREWAHDVEAALDALQDLLGTGHAGAVVELAEHAQNRVTAAIEYVDDSDGWCNQLSERIAELHLTACEADPPDPTVLAQRLVALEFDSDLWGFDDAVMRYADVLGIDGLTAYRHAIRQRARQLDDDVMADYRRRRLYAAEARAAEAQGDPDEVARVLEPRMHLPEDHLQVARAMHSAGRLEDAIGWCRRALADHADRPDHLLRPARDLLAQLLAEDGDHDAVSALRREEFAQRPSVGTYRQLVTAAADSGVEGDGAVQRLRDAVAEAVPAPARGVEIGGGELTPLATPLVAVLLERDEVEDAWSAATAYGCNDRTWHQLAQRRAATHPLEVVAIHHQQALQHAEQSKRPAYQAAVRALTHVERCCQAGDDPDRFAAIIDDVREQHGRKWSFMAMLDERGW